MTESVVTGLLTMALIVVVGYCIRLDMSDITGMARKAARSGMAELTTTLGYQQILPRTDQKQGGLEKQFPGFRIQVEGDMSRIQVEFNKSTALRFSSLRQNDFDGGDWAVLNFTAASLNAFFPLRCGTERWQQNAAALEALLLPLAQHFDVRAVKYLYIKDEYLRIGFYHRNYLPLNVIKESLPVLETFAKQFVVHQKQRLSS